LIKEQIEALARRELAALVLRLDTGFAPAKPRAVPPLLQFLNDVLHRIPFPTPLSVATSGPILNRGALHTEARRKR
jgi:hypothetical protein